MSYAPNMPSTRLANRDEYTRSSLSYILFSAAMLEQYKQQLEKSARLIWAYAMSLRDVRVAGQVLFAVIVLLVSWSGVKAIDANYVLEKQIATLQQQNTVQGLENENLKLQNDYYKSD